MKSIVLDPGHGGKDPGAVANGVTEKELNLNFACALGAALELAGYKISYTRTDDEFVSLSRRRDTEQDAWLFISIHHNSAQNKKANGVEVYYKPHSKGSKKVAEQISSAISHSCGLRNRGAKEGKFTVIQRKSASVLIELGFISNEGEASIVRTDEFIESAIKAIVKVVTTQ